VAWQIDDRECWPATLDASELQAHPPNAWLHAFLLRIPGRKRMTVADLGGDDGERLGFLADHFGEVVALATTSGQSARALTSPERARVRVHRVDPTDLGRFASRFDIALAIDVIKPRTQTCDRILPQIYRSLVEGGILMATFPAAPRIGGPVRLRLSSDDPPRERHDIHEVELQYRLRRAGYQGLRMQRLTEPGSGRVILACVAARRAHN